MTDRTPPTTVADAIDALVAEGIPLPVIDRTTDGYRGLSRFYLSESVDLDTTPRALREPYAMRDWLALPESHRETAIFYRLAHENHHREIERARRRAEVAAAAQIAADTEGGRR